MVISYRTFSSVKMLHIKTVSFHYLILIQLYVVGYVELLAPHWDVKTTQGIVRGYYKSNPPHFAFLGVPYARPPTGYDRFKAPKPPDHWDGIFEAIHKIKCPQEGERANENCLILNIFMPVNLTNMPTMVHFHDGDFLSLPGFLCLRSHGIPGNAGLKDQVVALYWIQRNINKFYGNSHFITVYGTGSGSVSIEILLLSGVADGLFQKAILESGSVLSPSSVAYHPEEVAKFAAQELGYKGDKNTNNFEAFFQDCSLMNFINLTLTFVPCIERHSLYSLLSNDPLHLMKLKKFTQMPMLIVYSDPKEMDIIDNKIFDTVPENFGQLLPNNLAIDTTVQEKVAKLTKDFYFGHVLSKEDTIQSYRDYVKDIFMEYPVVKSSGFYSYNSSSPVFLMKFSHRQQYTETFKGNYGNLLKLLFSDKVDTITSTLKTMWTNFIKLGDPTPITTSLIPDVWMPVDPGVVTDEQVKYQKINFYECGVKIENERITSQRFTFWEHIYVKFYKNH